MDVIPYCSIESNEIYVEKSRQIELHKSNKIESNYAQSCLNLSAIIKTILTNEYIPRKMCTDNHKKTGLEWHVTSSCEAKECCG